MRIVFAIAAALIAAYAFTTSAYAAFELDDPDFTFDEVIFRADGDTVFAPRAVKPPGKPPINPEGPPPGWTQAGGGDYAAFRAAEVLPVNEGSIEIDVVVMDASALEKLGREKSPESLVTVYDPDGVGIFTIGINDGFITAGSVQLQPDVMEGVFGGVGFQYTQITGGPPKDGTELKVCVEWGPDPSGNRVYMNGKMIGPEYAWGPRNMGPPGFEPTENFSSFMRGFTTGEGVKVGPADRLVVGRVGPPGKNGPFTPQLPKAAGIKSVRITNFPLYK